MKQNT